MPEVHIKYRVDKRMQVVELVTGTVKFLVPLQIFMFETSITEDSLDDANRGEAFIDKGTYKILRKGRL